MNRRDHTGRSPGASPSSVYVALPSDSSDADVIRRRGRLNAAILSLAIAAVAGVLHLTGSALLEPFSKPVTLPWAILAVAFACVHLSEVRFQAGRHMHTLHLGEVPLIAGLFLLDPNPLIAAGVLGTFGGMLLSRKSGDVVKVLFNMSSAYLSTVVAVLTFHLILQSASPMSNVGRTAAIAATAVVSLLTALLVPTVIRVAGGSPQAGGGIRELAMVCVGSTLVNATLGLVSVTILWWTPDGAWVLVGVAALFGAVHRGYDTLRTRHEGMSRLSVVTQELSAAVEVEALVTTLLGGARSLVRAEAASLVLDSGDVLTIVEPDSPVPQIDASLVLDIVDTQSCTVAGRGTRDPKLQRLLREGELPNAVVVAIRFDNRRLGALLVARRATDDRDFNREDARLLELLATHGGVALVNSRLVEELRRQASEREHEALHDGLTSLPNRMWFKRALGDVIDAEHVTSAVMLMDLDSFKDVNDTLGHHSGDQLLCQIATRLQDALASTGTIARLGGDEFAVLMPDIGGEIAAVGAAQQLLSVLEEPFTIEGSVLHVTASMGIALHPKHGNETVTLLRRADVAMYAAKQNYTRVEVYRSATDPYSPEKLALVSELRAALEAGDLTLAYQPKADLRTGKVIGVEALARWHHPERGYIPPDEFIKIAERTGLIAPLTTYVLREALRQCRDWRLLGLDLDVAVNLSLRSLSSDLPRTVARLLAETSVPARALSLEITETSIMIDVMRTENVLTELSEMGIDLSIDDFGTGYSSLAYLKRLPVVELKVDRSFVMNMTHDESDETIVRSTVDLARNLGLRVVAEGVEDATAWSTLAHMGCDLAQGYYLSPPLTATELTAWCEEQQRSTDSRRAPVRVRRGLPAET